LFLTKKNPVEALIDNIDSLIDETGITQSSENFRKKAEKWAKKKWQLEKPSENIWLHQ
jgi:hypothetical protein